MSDGRRSARSILEIIPDWMKGVAALLTAIVVAIVAFNTSQSNPPSEPAADRMTTPPEERSLDPGDDPAETPVPAETDSDVAFADEVIFGGLDQLDFDADDPREFTGEGIVAAGDSFQTRGERTLIVVWPDDDVPSQYECEQLVLEGGGTSTDQLEIGESVCGRTTEGRIFRITVRGIGTGAMRTDVVVWNP